MRSYVVTYAVNQTIFARSYYHSTVSLEYSSREGPPPPEGFPPSTGRNEALRRQERKFADNDSGRTGVLRLWEGGWGKVVCGGKQSEGRAAAKVKDDVDYGRRTP